MLLNDDLVLAAQKSVDGKMYKTVSGKHVPYSNSAEVLATIPNTRRHVGQRFRVANGAGIDDWHFVGGFADVNLVKIVTGGGSSVFNGFEVSPDFASISPLTEKRTILVEVDETNNGDASIYYHNGVSVRFGLTLPA